MPESISTSASSATVATEIPVAPKAASKSFKSALKTSFTALKSAPKTAAKQTTALYKSTALSKSSSFRQAFGHVGAGEKDSHDNFTKTNDLAKILYKSVKSKLSGSAAKQQFKVDIQNFQDQLLVSLTSKTVNGQTIDTNNAKRAIKTYFSKHAHKSQLSDLKADNIAAKVETISTAILNTKGKLLQTYNDMHTKRGKASKLLTGTLSAIGAGTMGAIGGVVGGVVTVAAKNIANIQYAKQTSNWEKELAKIATELGSVPEDKMPAQVDAPTTKNYAKSYAQIGANAGFLLGRGIQKFGDRTVTSSITMGEMARKAVNAAKSAYTERSAGLNT